jgi:hypothetical protein
MSRYAAEMQTFDQLPKAVKDAVRDSPVYLGTERILAYHRENGTAKTLEMIGTVVARWQEKHPMVEGPKR